MAIDWNICYRSGLFGIVWDLRGYVSALLVYLSGHNVIEWDAALLSVLTYWYRASWLAGSGECKG